MRSRVGIPGGVATLGSSAAHLASEQAGLLGLHGWELRVGTGPAIPRGGHHSSEAGGGAAGAFDQLGEGREQALLWLDLLAKRNRTE